MTEKSSPVPFEAIFESSLNAIGVHTLILDEAGRPSDYTYDAVNPAFEALTGLRARDILGKTVRQVTPEIGKVWTERYDRVALTGVPETFVDYAANWGKWFQVTAFSHKPMGFTTTFIDVTDQRAESERTAREAAKYRALFELGNAVKLIVDPENQTILDANPRAAEFYGWSLEELRGKAIGTINTAGREEIQGAMDQARTLKRDHFQFQHRLRSGEIRDVAVYSCPGPWEDRQVLYTIIHDITETLKLQERLVQSERLKTVGEMAASLGHEFGNLLGTLFAQIQLMELELPEGPGKDRLVSRVRDQVRRAGDLIEGIKAFSRDQSLRTQECRLLPLLKNLADLEGPLCRQAGITVEVEPWEDDLVTIDVTLVQQVFLNLFKNALQALRGVPSPRISITGRAGGSWVEVGFADNGPGIAPQAAARLFEPFFTTKTTDPEDQGTGLGLSFSRTVLRSHGGDLTFAGGPGARFLVTLPGNDGLLCPGTPDSVYWFHALPPVGIHDLSLAVPRNRMDLTTLAALRTAADPSLEKHLIRALATTGQRALRFPSPWEDTVTLAAEALRDLLDRRKDTDLSALRFLVLGTETSVDMSKPGSAYVQGLLQRAGYPLPASLSSFQVQHACAGGTLALLSVAAFLQAAGRDGETGVVLTSDIARYKAPSTAEVTQGAGAGALLVSRNPGLLELDLDTAGFASHDVDDFFRPLGSTVAQVKGRISQACYQDSLAEAFEDHCRRAGVAPADELGSVDAFFLHVPYARMPGAAMESLLDKHLGLDQAGSAAFLAERGFPAGLEATAEVGNLYTGSLYLSLAFGLTERLGVWGPSAAGRKVLMASYGSGNTMAVFTGRVAAGAARTVAGWDLGALLSGARDAPFEVYQAWLDTVRTPDNYPGILAAAPPPAGRFALTGLREDGYREYGIL